MKSRFFEPALRLIVALACFSVLPAQALDASEASRAVVAADDAGGKPFAIIDKVAARVYVFDIEGRPLGSAAALLGIAKGDHSVPGVGTMELSAIRVQDRTTPAGRFEAGLGRNYHGKQILWVDYDAAISMHPVINTKPSERRPQRLATPTAADNRISFGCINVPLAFFEKVVSSAFKDKGGVVYILPEMTSGGIESLIKSHGPTARNTAAQ
jgi:hypothetical protein